MDAKNQNSVYINMMIDALKRKEKIMLSLLENTREQEILLKSGDELDVEQFSSLIEVKGAKIEELGTIDEGFDSLFKVVEKEVIENRESYKDEIILMQKLITKVSELGMQIQALENQNSGHFKTYLASQRQVIRNFNVNNKTASNYYNNMANTHKTGQSYFFNEKK